MSALADFKNSGDFPVDCESCTIYLKKMQSAGWRVIRRIKSRRVNEINDDKITWISEKGQDTTLIVC